MSAWNGTPYTVVGLHVRSCLQVGVKGRSQLEGSYSSAKTVSALGIVNTPIILICVSHHDGTLRKTGESWPFSYNL